MGQQLGKSTQSGKPLLENIYRQQGVNVAKNENMRTRHTLHMYRGWAEVTRTCTLDTYIVQ